MDIISLLSSGQRAERGDGIADRGALASTFLTDQLTGAVTKRARTLLDVDQLQVDPFAATQTRQPHGPPHRRQAAEPRLDCSTVSTNLTSNREEVVTSRWRLGQGMYLEADAGGRRLVLAGDQVAAPLLTAMLAAASLAVGQGAGDARSCSTPPGYPAAYRLRHAFGVPEGSTLSRSEIRRGVQALLATGVVEDVVVDGRGGRARRRDPGQGAAGLAGRAAVTVLGLPSRRAKHVRATLGLAEGAPLRVPAFEAALERARQDLRERGLPRRDARPGPAFRRAERDGRRDGDRRPRAGRSSCASWRRRAAGIEAGASGDVCRLEAGQRLTSPRLEGRAAAARRVPAPRRVLGGGGGVAGR